MDCSSIIEKIKEKKHLISMSSLESLLELGFSLDFNESTSILGICCGYGGML